MECNDVIDKIGDFFSTIAHTVIAVFSIAYITLGGGVPYPSLYEGLASLQYMVYIAIIVFQICVLLLNCYKLCNCGCLKEKWRKRVFKVYFVCFAASLTINLYALIYISTIYRNNLRATVEDTLYEQVTELFGEQGYADITDAINALQRAEKCCGAGAYYDYFNSAFASSPKYGDLVLPVTCFTIPEYGCIDANSTGDEFDRSKIYDEGCAAALTALYKIFFDGILLSIGNVIVDVVDCIRLICCTDVYRSNQVWPRENEEAVTE